MSHHFCCNRRHFLGKTIVGGATMYLASHLPVSSLLAAADDTQKIKDRMKIGCGTVSFRKLPIEEAFACISKAGFEYVEPQAVPGWCPHVDVWKDDPETFKKLVAKFGLKGATALWSPNGAMLNNPTIVKDLQTTLQWAAAAGIPVVNVGEGYKPDDLPEDEAWKIIQERLAPVLETAEKCRVFLAFEPHGTFSVTTSGLTKLMSLSDSKWLGVNYDAANVHRKSYVETVDGKHEEKQLASGKGSEVETLAAVVNRVVHFHIKDVQKQGDCVALGEGTVNNAACIDLLVNAGYTGAISLETEGDFDIETGQKLIEKSRAYMLKLLGRTL